MFSDCRGIKLEKHFTATNTQKWTKIFYGHTIFINSLKAVVSLKIGMGS